MFKILFLIGVVIEIPLVALFLKYYWPDRCKQSFITKVVCSLIFVLLGIFAAKETGNNTLFADYMICGLVFGMAGDLLLHAMTTKMLPFILGVISFLIGHIYYIMAIQRAIYTTAFSKGAFTWYEILIVLAIIVIAIIQIRIQKQQTKLQKWQVKQNDYELNKELLMLVVIVFLKYTTNLWKILYQKL